MAIGTPKPQNFFEKTLFYPLRSDTFSSYSLIDELISRAQARYPNTRPLSRGELIEVLEKEYSTYLPHISKLICYDLGNLKLTIPNPPPVLKIECMPDIPTRHDLWEMTEEFYGRTGWYPYVTGINEVSKGLIISQKIERALEHHADDNVRKVGGLGSYDGSRIASLLDPRIPVPEGDIIGNSAVVQTEAADIILDAGIPRDRMNMDNLSKDSIRLVLITHPHEDHARAFREFLADRDTYILAGYVTLEFLLRKYCGKDVFRDLLTNSFFERFIPLRFDKPLVFRDGSSVTAVQTEHYPGAVGFILKFCDGKELYYSGDVNFESKYVKEATISKLRDRMFECSIIDGSQLSRRTRDKEFKEDPGDVLAGLQESLEAGENNIIVTNSADRGAQLALSLYPKVIRKTGVQRFCPLFLDEDIISQIGTVEYWLQRGEKKAVEHLDQDIVGGFRKAFLTRSIKVYPYDEHILRRAEEMNAIGWNGTFVLDEARLAREPAYLPEGTGVLLKQKKVRVTVLTKKALDPSARRRLAEMFGEENITEVEGHRWHLHTPAEALRRIVCENADTFGQVYVFHTTNGMIRDFDSDVRALGYRGKVRHLPANFYGDHV